MFDKDENLDVPQTSGIWESLWIPDVFQMFHCPATSRLWTQPESISE
jgi:hypothetical protein